jgi:hypothetical protein
VLAKHGESGNGDGEQRRLGVLGELQLIFGAFETKA